MGLKRSDKDLKSFYFQVALRENARSIVYNTWEDCSR